MRNVVIIEKDRDNAKIVFEKDGVGLTVWNVDGGKYLFLRMREHFDGIVGFKVDTITSVGMLRILQRVVREKGDVSSSPSMSTGQVRLVKNKRTLCSKMFSTIYRKGSHPNFTRK